MVETAITAEEAGSERIVASCRRHWGRRLADRIARPAAGPAVRWRSAGWSCSTRRPAIASSSTASRRSKPRPACASASAGSRDRSSARRELQGSRGQRPAGRVPDQPRDHARLGARRMALQQPPHRPAGIADWCALDRLPKLRKTGAQGAAPARLRHPHRPARGSTGWSWRAAVSGTARTGSLLGEADIRAGRAMVGLQLAMLDGDRLAARLDAEPDRDRFDVDVRAIAPRDGLHSGAGRAQAADRPDDRRATAAGPAGAAAARLLVERRDTADLALAADSGRYRLSGMSAPSPFLKGRLQRLTAPVVKVRGDATLRRPRSSTAELTLASPSLRAVASGTIDLAEGALSTRSASASTCCARRPCSPT